MVVNKIIRNVLVIMENLCRTGYIVEMKQETGISLVPRIILYYSCLSNGIERGC